MPNTPNLTRLSADQLAAELARREAEAAAQQAAAAADWKAEQTKRAREVFDTWRDDDETLTAAEHQAHDDWRAAVIAAPMVAAFIRMRQLRHRRSQLRSEAQFAAQLLGEDAEQIPDMGYYGARILDDIRDIADAEANRLAGEESAAVFARLQAPDA